MISLSTAHREFLYLTRPNISLTWTRNLNINPTGLHNLTYILVLHPIAGFFGLLALIFGIIGVAGASRAATIIMSVLAFFAALLTLVAFVIDMVLWNLVKKRIQDGGFSATLVSHITYTSELLKSNTSDRETPTGSQSVLSVLSHWQHAPHSVVLSVDSPRVDLPVRR
jgi:Zn-dependent protease with chaperone function